MVLSAPKGSVLEAVEQGDGTSQLIMNSQNKGEIMVYIADPRTNDVKKYQGWLMFSYILAQFCSYLFLINVHSLINE